MSFMIAKEPTIGFLVSSIIIFHFLVSLLLLLINFCSIDVSYDSRVVYPRQILVTASSIANNTMDFSCPNFLSALDSLSPFLNLNTINH